MAQVVHSIAPDAKICFYATGSVFRLVEKLGDVNGPCRADIIVDDLVVQYFPPFEDARSERAIDTFTKNGGLYFPAASNQGGRAFRSLLNFVPAIDGSVPSILKRVSDVQRWHRFADGSFFKRIPSRINKSDVAMLYWNEPKGMVRTAAHLFMYAADFSRLGRSIGDAIYNGLPFQRFTYTSPTSVIYVAVGAARQLPPYKFGAPPLIGYIVAGSDTQSPGAAMRGHPSADTAITTAAFKWDMPSTVASYSTWGPALRYWSINSEKAFAANAAITGGSVWRYESNATVLSTNGIVRRKPELGGADCLTTSHRAFGRFCGTSCAAPSLASIVALLKEMFPCLTRDLLLRLVIDESETPVRWDQQAGYGLIKGDLLMTRLENLIRLGRVPSCIDRS